MAAVNMTNDGFHSYTYDAEGNITAVDSGSTATYVYNALNQRVRATVGGAITEYVFNGRWPGHKIAKNCCAPFIHSFIVDEWETMKLNPPGRWLWSHTSFDQVEGGRWPRSHTSFDQVEGGRWPWSHTSFDQVEGAPGPSPLGTGEEEPNCR
jgi:hypothetical protein